MNDKMLAQGLSFLRRIADAQERCAVALERLADEADVPGKTQKLEDIARRIGYTPGYVFDVLRGTRKPSAWLRLRLAELDITTTVTGEAL